MTHQFTVFILSAISLIAGFFLGSDAKKLFQAGLVDPPSVNPSELVGRPTKVESDQQKLFTHFDFLLKNRDYLSLEAALQLLAEQDPVLALQWCRILPKRQRPVATNKVLSVWFLKDPAQAFSWARLNSRGFFAENDFIAACLQRNDLSMAVQGINCLSDPLEPFIFAKLGKAWSLDAQSRNTALQQISAWVPDNRNRVAATQGIIESWAQTDHEAALSWGASNATNYREKVVYLSAAIKGWIAGNGVNDAIDYLNTAPAAYENWQAYGTIATALATSDPAKAYDWIARISSLPDGPPNSAPLSRLRDIALDNPMLAMMKTRPDLAAQLATLKSTESRLMNSLESILPLWSARDPQAANAFLNTVQGLSPSNRIILQQKFSSK